MNFNFCPASLDISSTITLQLTLLLQLTLGPRKFPPLLLSILLFSTHQLNLSLLSGNKWHLSGFAFI